MWLPRSWQESLPSRRVEFNFNRIHSTRPSVDSEVTNLASQYAAAVGWQSNKHGGAGAGCNGGGASSCDPDGPVSPYFQLLQNGAANGGKYLEVWSTDVVNYPQGFAAARSAGFYPATRLRPIRVVPFHS